MIQLLEGRRLVVVHNPHSSRARDVQRAVFDRLDRAGYTYVTLEVRQASLEDNIARLAPQIQAHDVIISAAGDGSAHALSQAVIAANKTDVSVGFLAFGNFNDLPHTFTSGRLLQDPVAFLEHAHLEVLYPLVVEVNGRRLRQAMLYVTAGWTAQAASRFDRPEFRQFTNRRKVNIIGTMWQLGLYYFRSRRYSYLPTFTYNKQQYVKRTDVLCVNGPVMARLARTGVKYYQKSVFLLKILNVARLLPSIPFLVGSTVGRMPGSAVEAISLDFQEPSAIPLQCDGEVVILDHVSQLTIKKSVQPFTILTTK